MAFQSLIVMSFDPETARSPVGNTATHVRDPRSSVGRSKTAFLFVLRVPACLHHIHDRHLLSRSSTTKPISHLTEINKTKKPVRGAPRTRTLQRRTSRMCPSNVARQTPVVASRCLSVVSSDTEMTRSPAENTAMLVTYAAASEETKPRLFTFPKCLLVSTGDTNYTASCRLARPQPDCKSPPQK